MRGHQLGRLCAALLMASAVAFTPAPAAAADAPVADAAEQQSVESVRALLKKGVDVNAAQGDGMTALHWAAMHNDGELAKMLLYAGANARATTRLGGYTPLHLAAQAGAGQAAQALVEGGASVATRTSTGATPLMLAAQAGSLDVVKLLLDKGADANATDSVHGETSIMFAAALNHADVVKMLVARGADMNITARVFDYTKMVPPGDEETNEHARREAAARARSAAAARGETAPAAGAKPAAPKRPDVAGVTRPYTYSELVGREGGLTPLHFAARQGAFETVRALVDANADVNAPSAADHTTPLLIAVVNGQFDIAQYLLDHGASPNLASDDGATPLYAAINTEWAPKSFYPQPRAQYQQQVTYLDLMRALLDKGADPNVRLKRKLWYTQYNFDLLRIDETGATPFWRAAYSSDIDAMTLLVARGADPTMPTLTTAGRVRGEEPDRDREPPKENETPPAGAPKEPPAPKLPPLPVGAPGIPPLLAAAGAGYGEGFAANAHRFAPSGMMAAVKYLVEELHADVNATDQDGNTALHNAASRGDNEMIQYLVSKGADVMAVNRQGQTTVDMANGPVQRTQPYPETIKLLESLGAKNNHKCVSCD